MQTKERGKNNLSAIALSMGNVTKGDVFQVVQVLAYKQTWLWIGHHLVAEMSRLGHEKTARWITLTITYNHQINQK